MIERSKLKEVTGLTMPKFLSTQDVAEEFETDDRTLRRFLRKYPGIEPVGKGNRYQIERRRMRGLRRAFEAWQAEDARRAPKPETASETPDAEREEELAAMG